MQCKYCGKETTGEMEVCPECEKRPCKTQKVMA